MAKIFGGASNQLSEHCLDIRPILQPAKLVPPVELAQQ
jgi:hypothetical protein